MAVKIIMLITWLVVSILEGTRDAFYFHNRVSATNPDKKNMHWLFTL